MFEWPRTILFASILAGVLHATTQSVLIDRYVESNPWYRDQMQGPSGRLRAQFLVMGVVIGAGFGALVAGIAWGLAGCEHAAAPGTASSAGQAKKKTRSVPSHRLYRSRLIAPGNGSRP